MSNLIREKRLDKNGVLTTKLVRAESKSASPKKSLPAPFALSPKVNLSDHQRGYLESLEKERSHRVEPEEWRDDADAALRSLCSGMKLPKKLKCTDAEIMDVLGVVSEENVLPLMSAGVRSAKQAKKLLKANGLDRLLTDNESQVKNLVKWAMHPRNAVMPKRSPRNKDIYSRGDGYGRLSLNFAR